MPKAISKLLLPWALLSCFFGGTAFGVNTVALNGVAPVPQLYPIYVNNRIGFIDATGQVVIEPKYNWSTGFHEGVAGVCLEPSRVMQTSCGFVDPSGNWTIPPKYDDIDRFSEGLAVVRTGKVWQVIDRQGRIVVPQLPGQAGEFSCGRAQVVTAKEYLAGYVDRAGNWVAPFAYWPAGDYQDGYALVEFLAEKDGTPVRRDVPSKGFLGEDGKEAFGRRFANALPFNEGRAPVQLEFGGPWGYLDVKGNMVIPPSFETAGGFSEGLADIAVGGLAGYIDRDGRFVIPPQFYAAGPFRYGLASVIFEGGKTAYIDHSGAVVLRFDASVLPMAFAGDLAMLITQTGLKYIKRDGTVVWECDEENPKLPVCGFTIAAAAERQALEEEWAAAHEKQVQEKQVQEKKDPDP